MWKLHCSKQDGVSNFCKVLNNRTQTKINYAPILLHECDILVGNVNKIIGMPFEEVDVHVYIVYFCN